MWKELIAKKAEWIGGKLIDEDPDFPDHSVTTTLLDIRFAGIERGWKRDEDWIEFIGKDFYWGGSTQNIGLACQPTPPGQLRFVSAFRMQAVIQMKDKT